MNRDELQPTVEAIQAPPMLTPTAEESAALSIALAEIEIAPQPNREADIAARAGLRGFVFASITAFALVATVLALQTFGLVSILSLIQAIGPPLVALILVVVVFVTSFVPIAVTARRRPLNGMTFRR